MRKDIDYSFKVLEQILTFKQYNSKEEVVQVAKMMLDKVNAKDCPQEYKDFYLDAYNKIDSVSFDEIKELIDILASNAN